MTTIGIYDSGAGGLTVLAEIIKRFSGNAVYYFADNANSPFGEKTDDKLAEVVADGLANVQANSDITVIACNTASTLLFGLARGTKYEDKLQKDVFILQNCEDKPSIKPIYGILPPLYPDDGALISYVPKRTLLLATDGTKRHVSPPAGTQVADTAELADMIEKALCSPDGTRLLLPYLAERLAPFKGVRTVILGCTHYPFCKREISAVLGRVRFLDGSRALLNALSESLTSDRRLAAPVNFAFSGRDESEKYSAILRELVNGGLHAL